MERRVAASVSSSSSFLAVSSFPAAVACCLLCFFFLFLLLKFCCTCVVPFGFPLGLLGCCLKVGIASILTVVVTFRMPAGPRRHFRLSRINVRSSWVAEEGGETYKGAAVHGFHEDASPFAGSPYPEFGEFSQGSLEECLLTKVSL